MMLEIPEPVGHPRACIVCGPLPHPYYSPMYSFSGELSRVSAARTGEREDISFLSGKTRDCIMSEQTHQRIAKTNRFMMTEDCYLFAKNSWVPSCLFQNCSSLFLVDSKKGQFSSVAVKAHKREG